MATDSVPEPARVAPSARTTPSEAWILAGTLDGRRVAPALDENVGGLPHLFRLAGELQMAGVKHAYVISREPVARELLDSLRTDPRLSKITVAVVAEAPSGGTKDAIVVVRGDRIFHRDIPKAAISAWTSSRAKLAKVAGDEHDAVVVTDRVHATILARTAADAGKLATELRRIVPAGRSESDPLHSGDIATAEPPYLAFTTAAPDRASLRRAERKLVWSLRKSADGIASKLINRHVSLPITWLLMRTRALPNHVTLCALACAIAGAFVIAHGGYAAGAAGMLLVELGSIIDGIDGELARAQVPVLAHRPVARHRRRRRRERGLQRRHHAEPPRRRRHLGGAAWAVATIGFVLTQWTQYWLITRVYNSGDLAAIPWAFQSTEFLSQRPKGVMPG